jgi:hypothetical protein
MAQKIDIRSACRTLGMIGAAACLIAVGMVSVTGQALAMAGLVMAGMVMAGMVMAGLSTAGMAVAAGGMATAVAASIAMAAGITTATTVRWSRIVATPLRFMSRRGWCPISSRRSGFSSGRLVGRGRGNRITPM